MWLTRFLRGPNSNSSNCKRDRRCSPARKRNRHFAPRLESLECRTVPATFLVHNLADSGDGSLRAAVGAAEDNPGADVIRFAPQVQGTIGLTTGELLMSEDLTVKGPGANRLTVSGTDNSRIFNVVGGADAGAAITVNIAGLTITRGRADDAGGGILNSGFSDLTLSGVVLSNNVAVGVTGPNANGGAIFSDGSGASLNILNSRVVGNTADGRDVVRAIGGGVAVQFGSLRVANSTIADNRSLGAADGIALGGGIRLRAATGEIHDCIIRNNRALGGPDGGEAFGGGIGVLFSSLVLADSALIGNEARGGDGGVFGQAGGGALDSPGSEVSINNCLLLKNRAVGGSGGVNSGDDFSVGTAFGGAIANGGFLDITRSVFSGNQAVGGDNGSHTDAPTTADVGAAHGGAICNAGGVEAVISECTFAYNLAIGGDGNTGTGPVAFVGAATGGAIDNSLDLFIFGEPDHQPATLTVLNSTLMGNQAIGGIDNVGDGDRVFAGAGLGGGLANYLGAVADISGSVLAGNRAIGGAGGLGAGGGIFNGIGEFTGAGGTIAAPTTVTVSGTVLKNNEAQGGTDGDGLGGGVYNDAATELALEHCVVTRNEASDIGGGIYNLGTIDIDPATLIFANVADEHDDCFGCP